jgi:hypothetical protein
MKNIKTNFEDFINEKLKENERLIVVIAYATAIIDDELSFFEDVYQNLISENPKLKGEDLTVFLRVQADFSSGNGIYKIKKGKIKEAGDKIWSRVSYYLK